ncbi:MAG: UDP-N-acetylmuramate--L-alanine ligase [Elusimicrobiales bacterium]|jgi:UDP-N-acetylmuramate--alanine ligase|nr:UDP-N-acetylmuramate--L-alanine ligase [Elusimicrobiales bacterium]NLH40012.1 UDP-N-acetylmuramate--L-alanine ligase [Elusimicrobiota bacterium]
MNTINNTRKIHFIGVGGIGMSGLAVIARRKGYSVSGSDITTNYITEKLKKEGIKFFLGHRKENVKDAALVVMSSAIKPDNPELVEAQRLSIPVMLRAKFLSMLTSNSKLIAVAGSHGKTSTTSMITSVFESSNKQYTSVIGGISKHINSNIKFEKGEYFIIEADESDGSFLYYSPLVVCVTNIDNDHLDFYKNIDNIKKAFVMFMNRIPFYGRAVICGDDKNIRDIIQYLDVPYYTYGFQSDNIWTIKNLSNDRDGIIFDIYYKKSKESQIKLNVFGVHNALNATSSYIAARYVGFDKKDIENGLLSFKGVKRRLDLIGSVNNVLFYDDYGHHPNEIKSTLNSLKTFYPDRRLVVIFQPHRYTRTKFLYRDFAGSFNDADKLYVMDIYPASEKPIKGVSSRLITDTMRKNGKKNVYDFTTSIDVVKDIMSGDIILSLGAGDVYKTLGDIKIKYENIA